jgi:hypothetical protein
MGELGREVRGGVSKVDGEAAAPVWVHVLIGGEVILRVLLLFRPLMLFFYFFSLEFILLLW